MPNKNQYKNKLEYNNTYNRNNYRSFSVRFNNKTETGIIEWLESQESIKGYLTALIEADIKKQEKKKKAASKNK
ncbi:MAG: hypothetical protein IJM63_13555 [Solobacterium sp.]|nr:hypothetical protein [Solobacterium sp.]MBQ9825520.1 hypothetical protein [Solobacterium sp.]